MKTEPLVTILMPAYNHEDFIQEAINSLIKQSYKNIELFITNDGSTDNTENMIQAMYDECTKRFVNFKYINRANKGLVHTLKEMEHLINGKYLTVLYSDDIFTKDRIQKQVEALENNKDYAMCYGRMTGIDLESNIIKHYKYKHAKSGYVFNELLKRNFVTAPTVMMRTDKFKSVGGYDLNYEYDDYSLWLKLSHKNKILFLNEELVYYRTHPNNVSSDIVQTIKFTESVLLSWNKEPAFKSAIKRFYLRSFYNLVKEKANYKAEAKEYMLKSLPYSFYDPRFLKALFRYYLF